MPQGGTRSLPVPRPQTIIFPMSDKHGLESELKRLERQLDELLAVVAQLREENRALRHRQDNLTNERATLLQRNEQVRTRVEAMIGRLKTLEQGA
ncbi:MAG: hypothetical protein RL469_1151 [Pseudomonadota bacterium]